MIVFPNGSEVPALGQGTWNMGDSAASRDSELEALRAGVELGLTVLDTAEKNSWARRFVTSGTMFFL
jgi:diketogulonate reductase-like aldo/keto reductase